MLGALAWMIAHPQEGVKVPVIFPTKRFLPLLTFIWVPVLLVKLTGILVQLVIRVFIKGLP